MTMNDEVTIGTETEELLFKTQTELQNYQIVDEEGRIDGSYSNLLKAYSDLYEAHEHAASEICKNNNEAVKIEYDNQYRSKELELREKELKTRETELEIRKLDADNRVHELDLREREIDNKVEETRLKAHDIDERIEQAKEEFKQKKKEARRQLIFELIKIFLTAGSTATMIWMHERDKKYNNEDMLTNPEAKEHTKRMWNGILGLGKNK